MHEHSVERTEPTLLEYAFHNDDCCDARLSRWKSALAFVAEVVEVTVEVAVAEVSVTVVMEMSTVMLMLDTVVVVVLAARG